jgi:hypothetical protein
VALEFAHGAIQLTTGAIGTTFTVSGLSFQPKALRFYWMGINSATDAATGAVNLRRGVGFAASTSSRRAVSSFSQDASLTSNCDTGAYSDCVVATTAGAGTRDGAIDLNAINSDGFQLIVDDVLPAAMTLFWEAWGGSDISNVTIGDFAEPAATGTQSYSATGFEASPAAQDQVVMLAGVQSTAAIGSGLAADSGFYAGFTTGSGQQCVVAGNADDASGTMDTDGYGTDTRCVAMCVVAGGTTNGRAAFSAWGTDQFTLNWEAVLTANRKSIYMAIKGGRWQAGGSTIDGSTANATSTVSGLPFTPIGVSMMGRIRAEQGTAFDTQDIISLGSGSSTSSRRAMGCMDENATASSACEISEVVEYDSVLAYPSTSDTLQGTRDINAMNSDGFQLIVDTAGGVSSVEWYGYLAFGNEPQQLPPPSLVMPPMRPATFGAH